MPAEAEDPVATAVAPAPEVVGSPITPEPLGPDPETMTAVKRREKNVMPKAGKVEVVVGTAARRAGSSPVILAPVGEAQARDATPEAVTVEILEADETQFVGPGGFAFTIEAAANEPAAPGTTTEAEAAPSTTTTEPPTTSEPPSTTTTTSEPAETPTEEPEPGSAKGAVQLEIDYAAFRQAFGGDYAARLVLMKYPACVLDRPDDPECAQGQVVETTNDYERSRLRTTVDIGIDPADIDPPLGGTEPEKPTEPTTTLPEEAPSSTTTTIPSEEGTSAPSEGPGSESEGSSQEPTFARQPAAAAPAQAGSGGSVYGLVSGVAGTQGTFGATSLDQASRWTAGGSTGSFAYSYPLEVPAATVGPTPSLSLDYSSGAVDGLTAAENGQSGFVGAGWGLNGLGFIERRFRTCSDDGGWLTADLCWHSNNATISLNGVSSELVPTSTPGEWKLERDPGWKVTHRFDAKNGDDNKEWWIVTTPDGTRYWFGYGQEAESVAATPTNSAWTAPVYGNDSGEPCYSATVAAAWCNQVYRWNLDHVEDTSGSFMTVFWTAETNRYGRMGYPAQSTEYVRGGYPSKIEYSQRSGNHTPAGQVLFVTAGRCLEAQFFVGCPAATSANASSWPDVPMDLICTSTTYCTKYAPSFFSMQRLDSVYTLTTDASNVSKTVDRYQIQTRFPDPGDGTDPRLWLNDIQQTGYPDFLGAAGQPLALPWIHFDGTMLANRADTGTSVPATKVPRVTTITEELGAKTLVSYGQPTYPCVDKNGPWDTNQQYCFPVYFKPDGQPAGWSVNHKYVVTSVTSRDATGGSPDQVTTYSYDDAPGWHHDDDSVALASRQSWSDWRGHSKVTATDGLSTTSFLYYRGLYGDKLIGGGTRTTTLTTKTGAVSNDWNKLAGQVREQRQTDASDNTQTATITGYLTPQTGSGAGMTAERVLPDAVETRMVQSGGDPITTRTTTTYNGAWGWMPQEVHAYGEPDTNNDDRCTRYTYAQDQTRWILDRVARESVDYNCSSPYNRITDTFYDGSSTLGQMGSGPGLPTKVRQHLDQTASGAYVETQTGYDGYGRVTSQVDGRGKTTTTAYSPSDHRLTASITHTAPLGYATTTVLDARRQQPTTVTDVRGRATTQGYDSLGRLTSVDLPQDPSGWPSYRFVYTVNQTGTSKVETKRLNGAYSLYNYVSSFEMLDAFGRVRETQAVSPGPTAGRRLVTATKYTAQGRIARQSNTFGTSGTAGADLVNATNPPGEIHHIYDLLGREVRTKQMSYGTFKWESETVFNGLTTTSISPEGRRSRAMTNALGHVRKVEERTPANNLYSSTAYTGGVDGEILTVKDDPDNNVATDTGSSVWSYTYDMLGRRLTTEDPDAGSSSVTYDGNGNVVSSTDANSQQLHTVYDDLNRPIERRLDSTTGPLTASWTYYNTGANKGFLDTATSVTAVGDWTTKANLYDTGGRATSTTYTVPSGAGSGLAGSYTYTVDKFDTAGRVLQATTPATADLPAEQLTSTVTTLGLPSGMSSSVGAATVIASSGYDDNGRLASVVLGSAPNQVQRTYGYEAIDRLSSMKTMFVGGTTSQDDRFSYDMDGHITEINDAVTGQRECFKYDHLARLTNAWTTDVCTTPGAGNTATGPSPYEQSFTYDRIGNLTSSVSNGTTVTNQYGDGAAGPHALTSSTSGGATTTYTYDANGSRVSEAQGASTRTYDWDEQRQLTSVDLGSEDIDSVYSADGTRLMRQEPDGAGGVRTTVFLPNQEVTRSAAGAVTATRYLGDGSPVAMRTASGLQWLLGDLRGSSSFQGTVGGSTMVRQRYLPYGSERGGAVLTGTDRSYLGKVRDDASELLRTDHRFYDPAGGAFLSPDPVVHVDRPQSLNGYRYALNNPTSRTDGSGLDSDMEALANFIQWVNAAKKGESEANAVACWFHSRYCKVTHKPWEKAVAQVAHAAVSFPGRTLRGFYFTMKVGSCGMSANMLNGATDCQGGPNDPRMKVAASMRGKGPGEVALGFFGLDLEECREEGNYHCATTAALNVLLLAVLKKASGSAEAGIASETGTSASGLAARAARVRSALNIGKGRNVAVAEFSIDGASGELTAISGEAIRPGTVGMPNDPVLQPSKAGGYVRLADAEYKLLEDVAARLGDVGAEARGSITVYTERAPCSSCAAVIKQFEERYPNIEVTVENG